MENNKIKEVYFGTANKQLQSIEPINPEFKGGRIFEFGNGFYVSTDKSISEQYAINAISHDKWNRKLGKSINDEHIGTAYVHIYKINYELMKEEQKEQREFYDEEKFEEVLNDTIHGYMNSTIEDGYFPKYHYTYGFLCGNEWDDFWKIYCENDDTGKVEFNEEDIEAMIQEFIFRMAGTKQIAIHRTLNGENDKVKNLKYFKYEGKDVINLYCNRVEITHPDKTVETRPYDYDKKNSEEVAE